MKTKKDIKKGDIPTRQEMADKLRSSSRNVLDNLLKAWEVRPDTLTPEQEEELKRAIAKAESFVEKIETMAKKIERGESA